MSRPRCPICGRPVSVRARAPDETNPNRARVVIYACHEGHRWTRDGLVDPRALAPSSGERVEILGPRRVERV